jgi:hypothetical protein
MLVAKLAPPEFVGMQRNLVVSKSRAKPKEPNLVDVAIDTVTGNTIVSPTLQVDELYVPKFVRIESGILLKEFTTILPVMVSRPPRQPPTNVIK